jgi:hypothetical protein
VRSKERRRREDHQNAVEFLCVNIASLNTDISDPTWPASVKALTSAEPLADAWYTAIRQLHKIAEDADIPGGLGLTTPMGPHDWPGGSRTPPVAGWVCPWDACTRVELADRSPAPPQCHLRGLTMRLVEG